MGAPLPIGAIHNFADPRQTGTGSECAWDCNADDSAPGKPHESRLTRED